MGTVVSGTTLRGLIRLNDTLLLGPDPLGTFIPIAVKSIHRKRMPVKEVHGGQTASFALKKVCRGMICPFIEGNKLGLVDYGLKIESLIVVFFFFAGVN